MSASEPGKIITPWAESGLKNPIPPAANPATGRAGFDQGFSAINMTAKEAGGIPPLGQDFNGIFYEVTNILRYMQAGGQPTFDAALATAIGGYPKGAVVLGSDGVTLWQSQIESNFVDPDIDPSNWGTFDIGLKAQLAALGGASLIGPGVMTRGVDKFSIMQGRDGEYRQDTLTRGLAVELNEPITGSGFAGATNTYMFNRLYIKDDKVDAQGDGTPGTKVDGLIVQHRFGGPGSRGGRHAAEFALNQTGATELDNTDRNYVGIVGSSGTDGGDGGDATKLRGSYFGGNFYVSIKNAPYAYHANGCESNVFVYSGSDVLYRSGYSAVSGGDLQGTQYDAAFAVGALGLSGAKWKDALLVGAQNGRIPISRALIRSEDSGATSAISFKNAIPTNLIASDTDTRFRLQTGILEMFNTNASVRLGSKTAANTPYIEAWTDASGNYAGRLVFTGDGATQGNGVMSVQFRQMTVRELTPSTANAHLCGISALPWAGGFTQTAFAVTSDERLKVNISSLLNSEDEDEKAEFKAMRDAWRDTDLFIYQLIDRVEKKREEGKEARWHLGIVAQRAIASFTKYGLDWSKYSIFNYDKWDSSPAVTTLTPAVLDEDGNEIEPEKVEITSPAIEAGDKYTINYEEALILAESVRREDQANQDAFNQDILRRLAALERGV